MRSLIAPAACWCALSLQLVPCAAAEPSGPTLAPAQSAEDQLVDDASKSLEDSSLEALRQQLRQLEADVESFSRRIESNTSNSPSGATSSDVLPDDDFPEMEPYSIVYEPASVADVIADTPSYPTIVVTGLFQADAGWIHQTEANREAVGDAQDGADFRRARLAARGSVAENVGYMVEFDFAFPGRPSFMDVWLELEGVVGGDHLRIGMYRQPIGMDGLNSVKELTFIERALPFALLPFRQIGVMAHGTNDDETSTWAVSVFRYPTDEFGSNIGDNDGYGMASRLTVLPVDEGDDALLHLGAAFSFAAPSQDRIQYQSQPEFFLAETGTAFVPAGVPRVLPPFVDTGPIDADSYSLFGLETGTRMGSFYTQSELLISVVDQQSGDTAVFAGGYTQAGYFLTGEVRPYDRQSGVFGNVVPIDPFRRHCGGGAWEVAGRYSFLDLDDAGIRGGRLHDLTLGLNWYLNQYVKLQLNYIHAFLRSPVNGHSDADIVALRAHLDF